MASLYDRSFATAYRDWEIPIGFHVIFCDLAVGN